MRYKNTLIAAFSLAVLGACGGKSDTALNSDSALGRDLAMAATDSTAVPKLEDVAAPPAASPSTTAPATKAPVKKPTTTPPKVKPPVASAPAPAPVPAPATPKTGIIESGTTLRFASNAKVCSNTSSVGDKFTAPLSASVSGTNGAEIPAGAMGTFEITEARTAKNSGDTTYLRVRLLAVSVDGNSYPVEGVIQSATSERVRSATKGTDAKKVAGGAIIGAIAGQIIGKNTKGTVIGAAAGAAAGTAAASATADYDTCMNSGSVITVRLSAPATIRVGGA